MMNNPEISIIIPVFNSALTIKRCIESILEQDFKSWELLLVDDGSSDNSREFCSKYAEMDSRIVFLCQEHNGVSSARNMALSQMMGTYVCFVDSDDDIEPSYLSDLYSKRNYDIVICGYYVDYYNDGNQVKQKVFLPDKYDLEKIENREDLQNLFKSGMIHINCNKLLKADIIKKNQLQYKNYPVNEDYLFMLSYLMYSNSLITIQKPLYHWIRRKNVLSGVNALPENLLAIYNMAHDLTRNYFGDFKISDQIFYYSYEFILMKYIAAYKTNILPKKEFKKKMADFHHNELVKSSYKFHIPVGIGEIISYYLQKNGHFSLFMLYNTLLKWIS